MRRIVFFVGLFTTCAVIPTLAAEIKQEHPGEIALMQGDDGRLSYRLAANGFQLYVSDRDAAGKSLCNGGCARAWIPLAVNNADIKPVGDWQIITRDDGTRQWAYRGRPVYSLFHDSPDKPIGDGVEGTWHLLVP